MKLRNILPTLPLWIMLGGIAYLVLSASALPITQVYYAEQGGAFYCQPSNTCDTAAVDQYHLRIMLTLVLAILLLPALYAWNMFLVKVVKADW